MAFPLPRVEHDLANVQGGHGRAAKLVLEVKRLVDDVAVRGGRGEQDDVLGEHFVAKVEHQLVVGAGGQGGDARAEFQVRLHRLELGAGVGLPDGHDGDCVRLFVGVLPLPVAYGNAACEVGWLVSCNVAEAVEPVVNVVVLVCDDLSR